MFKFVPSFIVAAVVAAGLAVAHAPVSAQQLPAPCDFITGGGFVLTNLAAKANFGAHGGCKHGDFWGHVTYVDHGGFLGTTPYHVNSIEVTGYFAITPTTRDICGRANTNSPEPQPVHFRVRMIDNGEPGTTDMFGIRLSNGYIVTTRILGSPGTDGGNIELHKANPSTTAPDPAPAILVACAGLEPPVGGGGPD